MLSAQENLEANGFACVPLAVPEELCAELGDTCAAGESSRCLLRESLIMQAVEHLRSSSPVAGLLPANAVAVQCSLFSKSGASNWLVPPHQDLSIPVAERVADPDCRGWS